MSICYLGRKEINEEWNLPCLYATWEEKRSMKSGIYHVYMLLGKDRDFATIETATCERAAG